MSRWAHTFPSRYLRFQMPSYILSHMVASEKIGVSTLRYAMDAAHDAGHLHGTFHRPDRTFENHMPLELDDCTNFSALFQVLAGGGFAGPFKCEIIAKDIPTYVKACVQARDQIAREKRH